jgi:hypothetical protein
MKEINPVAFIVVDDSSIRRSSYYWTKVGYLTFPKLLYT